MGFFSKNKEKQGLKHKADVILVEGVKETAEIIDSLKKLELKVILILTTKHGRQNFSGTENVVIFDKIITREALNKLVSENDVSCLIDASHAFAIEISKNSMAVCEKNEITYIRYDEEYIEFKNKNIIKVASLSDAGKEVNKIQGNVFVALGSKNLEGFISSIEAPSKIVPRVSPEPEDITKLVELGIDKSKIVAIKGTFSKELYFELFKHYKAKAIVVRDSGILGGLKEKILAALEQKIKIILITRPELEYENVVNGITQLIFWVGKIISSREED